MLEINRGGGSLFCLQEGGLQQVSLGKEASRLIGGDSYE